MAQKAKATTRSYTLGLLSPSEVDDWLPLWKRLYQTHHSVCQGAREYGEFYLNLRGGLAASLADCDYEPDRDRRRLLQRGARRMLALGWFSVESVRGAEYHFHRIRAACNSNQKPGCEHDHLGKVSDLKPGESLPQDLAECLLREVLSTHKGVSDEAELAEWVDDCMLALTARIRPDAVIVNRAASFAEWQKSVGESGAEMPEQARRILFTMCGDGFASLALPKDDAVKQDDERADSEALGADDSEGEDAGTHKGEADEAEPSNASRQVFGDLFGGDAAEKVSRAAGKEEFAVSVLAMLVGLEVPPTQGTILAFRQQQGLPELDISRPDRYPKEVSSSGAPTTVAKRYRKLLVSLNLWPRSDDESGLPRTQAVNRFGKHVVTLDEQSRIAHINALDLIEACQELTSINDGKPDAAPTSTRVFTPSWAPSLAERVAAATSMPVNAKPLNEFKRLMFALAARRISQTQTWTKLNEADRHKSAVREDTAKKALEELDSDSALRAWLIAYEEQRREDAHASSDFRITRRMIGECDAVFNAWQGTESADERETKTASIQAKSEKFGDARLYADLSEDPAAGAIWRHEQGAEILKQWVKLRQAQYDQQRLKIPRFCHPDPFHHPTWCEFGGSSKPKVWYAWKADSRPQSPEAGGDADGSRRLWMLLPDFGARQAKAVPMRWRNKRLSRDLGGVHGHTEVSVPRTDRLSIAAAKLPLLDGNKEPIRYRPEHPFTKDAKGWNARLQLDRETLERLERHWDNDRREWRDDGKDLRNARWFVTFAPALAASDGPGRDIHPKLGWKSSPHSELNKKQKREAHAKLILSRLPGLRVLSVDLGHRFAAACAVWHSLSRTDFLHEIAGRAIMTGGTAANDLFCHTQHVDANSGKKRTTIYRRIGEDFLRDPKTSKPTTTPHPAPWARLDRQFLIKLQGEEHPARAAAKDKNHDGSPTEVNEVALVDHLAAFVGLKPRTDDEARGRTVDELMSRAVRIATLGLKRHGRMAKIAYAFNPECPGIPGMGGSLDTEPVKQRNDKYAEFILKELVNWHSLATDTEYDGSEPRRLWNTHIGGIAPDFMIPDSSPTEPEAERPTRQKRRKDEDDLKERVKPIAGALTRDAAACRRICGDWTRLWKASDGSHARVPQVAPGTTGLSKTEPTAPATGWHAQLRAITDWVMGSHLEGATKRTWNQCVGGLSLDRIATMRSLYQLHKAFAMRARPDKIQGAPDRGDSNEGVAQGILNTMERLREQRVKQIASRIVEAALGVGRHKPAKDKNREHKRPQSQVDDPCHAIVIENLRNYRPDELQTRRENKALMTWSAGKVRKYLEEGCQLHGLHLREVMPNYTSQQCSRTGLPGMRCVDVHIDKDTGRPRAYWWPKAVEIAKTKGDAPSRLTVALSDRLADLKARNEPFPDSIRVPRRGGDLFVAARPINDQTDDAARAALQADLNAAANIGLRALMDPDFAGKWWYIPCTEDKVAGTALPRTDKVKGSACFAPDPSKPEQFGSLTPFKDPDQQKGKARRGKRTTDAEGKEITNFWCDVTAHTLRNAESRGCWLATPAYWGWVRKRVAKVLWESNQLGAAGEPDLAPDDHL